jgi:hypothetical protein
MCVYFFFRKRGGETEGRKIKHAKAARRAMVAPPRAPGAAVACAVRSVRAFPHLGNLAGGLKGRQDLGGHVGQVGGIGGAAVGLGGGARSNRV